MTHSGRILASETGPNSPAGPCQATAPFRDLDPESRHSAYGQDRTFRLASTAAIRGALNGVSKRTSLRSNGLSEL